MYLIQEYADNNNMVEQYKNYLIEEIAPTIDNYSGNDYQNFLHRQMVAAYTTINAIYWICAKVPYDEMYKALEQFSASYGYSIKNIEG